MKLVRENLYNFHKTGDVKSGLNIGIKPKIKAWLDEMGVEDYTINGDYSIDVNGDVDLSDKNLESFPDYIRFNIINGHFFCDNNQLTSLEGAPKEVGWDFSCSNNQLSSLEGAPKKVGGSFWCDKNELASLEGAPKKIAEDFSCSNNQLSSLEGSPKKVAGDFYCSDNSLTSLEGSPKKVAGDFSCSNNQLSSLEGAPKKVGWDFYCLNNKREFSVEEVKAVCNVERNIYV